MAGKPFVIKLLFDYLTVVDTEVVHDHDPLVKGVNPLKLFDEGEERIDGVAAHKNLCKH